MRTITEDEYEAMLANRVELERVRGKLEEARVHAMGQTAQVAHMAASLAQADARADALVAAMKDAARKLDTWPDDWMIAMRDVAAELRRAAA